MSTRDVFKKFPEQCTPLEFALAKTVEHENYGRDTFLIDGITTERVRFKDVLSRTQNLASYLFKNGLKKGEIVIYSLSRQIDQIFILLGTWSANGVPRALYVEEDEDTISQKITESNARWVFCDSDIAPIYHRLSKSSRIPWELHIIVCDKEPLPGYDNIQEIYNEKGEDIPQFELTGCDPAIIIPTSGSSGPSKGAVLSHEVFLHRILNLCAFLNYSNVGVIGAKATHLIGSMFPLIMLCTGSLGIFLSKTDQNLLITTVSTYKPNYVFAFTNILLSLGLPEAKGYDISSVETIITGGNILTPGMRKVLWNIPNLKNLIHAYGMTEMSGSVVVHRRGERMYDENSDVLTCGKSQKDVQIQIRDISTLEPFESSNKQGEICLKSKWPFDGYFNDPESTAKSFIDGWYRTGDVGYLDEEGYLFVVGRIKDVFKYYHNHISPSEIETMISQHPAVRESCVVPVADPGGHVPKAYVTLKNPMESTVEVKKDILEFVNKRLPTYKQLRGGLYIIEDFPKGKSGKIARKLVEKLQLESELHL